MRRYSEQALTVFAVAVFMLADLLAGALTPPSASAQSGAQSRAQVSRAVGSDTGFPLPRFVSVRNAPANLRVGPGANHKVDWQLMRAGMPVQIVDEFGLWRQVLLHDGARGWLHKSLLSGARTVYVSNNGRSVMHREPDGDSRIVAYVEQGVVLRAQECELRWCHVRKGKITGWMSRRQLWGIGATETFN